MIENNWWDNNLSDRDTADAITAHVTFLIADNQGKVDEDIINVLMYDSTTLNYANMPAYSRVALTGLDSLKKSKSFTTYNVVYSCVETLWSKIGKMQPRPRFVSTDGDFKTRQTVKKLNQYILGQFQQLDVYKVGRDVFRDAAIYGTGVLKVFRENEKIKIEKVPPYEIFVDKTESQFKNPQTIYQTKLIDLNVLLKTYQQYETEIKAAAVGNGLYQVGVQNTAQRVQVIEAWKLPSYENAGDGRHVIAIPGVCFLNEEWKRDYFPFLFLHYTERPIGFWGVGIPQILRGLQRHINKLLMKIEDCLDLLGVPWVMVERNAQIDQGTINNRLGNIIKYNKTPPSVAVFNVVPPDVFRHLEDLYNKAFQLTGISQLSAASMKPAGIESGVALRTMSDIESERFMALGQSYQDFYLALAPRLIDLSKEISEDSNIEMPVEIGGKYIRLNFKEVDLERDKYTIQCFPANLLSDKVEGRLSQIQDLLNAGLIDPDSAKELLQLPDLEKHQNLESSKREAVRKLIDRIADEAIYEPIDPYMPLDFALDYAVKVYGNALVEEYPEENLDALRQLIDDLQAQVQPAQPLPTEQPQAIPPEMAPEQLPQ